MRRIDQFSSPVVRRRDPLRLSNTAEIKSIISRFELKSEELKPRLEKYVRHERAPTIFSKLEEEPDVVDMETCTVLYSGESANIDRSDRGFFAAVVNVFVGVFNTLLKCCFGGFNMHMAILTVGLSTIAPRIFTHFLIYPCCRLLFGTLYPAYASYKAVRTKNVKEYVKWMMYWIVFALFTCAETFTDVFVSWFPFYYEIKILFVLWLLLPATKGSSILYRKFVHPALCRREQEIDECITKAKEQGYHTVLSLGSKGVNYATNVIMQTAIRGGGGLVQQLRKSYSLSDVSAYEDYTDGRSSQESEGPLNMTNSDNRVVRRSVSTKSRGPRPTSSPRVDMYFSEVDVNMTHNSRSTARDSVNLSHIRSSEDISSSYIPENSVGQDPLTRTSSVSGARTRSKVNRNTFTSIKRPGAAEDDEVIIEEIDDYGDSSFYVENSMNIYSDISFDQYLQFLASQNISVAADDNDAIYRKYVEFNSFFKLMNANKDLINETKTENIIKDEIELNANDNDNKIDLTPDIIHVDTKNVSDANLECCSDSSNNKSFNVTEEIIIIKDSDNESVMSQNTLIVSELPENNLFAEKTKVNIEIVGNLPENTQNIVIDKLPNASSETDKASIETKVPEMSEIDKSETLNVDNNNDNKDISSLGSTSNLSSDSEDAEAQFTTPDSSPVLKPKLAKSPKHRKRHAPPPPSSMNISDYEKIEPEKNTENKNVNVDLKAQDEISVTSNTANTSLIDNTEIIDEPAHDKAEIKQNSKTKPKKKDAGISKLLHLPSKFAFWNKADASDDNETLSHSNKSSEYGSTIDIEKKLKDISLDINKSLASLRSMSDQFEDANDNLQGSNSNLIVGIGANKNDKSEPTVLYASKSTEV